MVYEELFPEDAHVETSMHAPPDSLDVGSSTRGYWIAGNGLLKARDCVACHALALHGSGCGRRVSVLEFWTLANMRRLHNKSLQ